MRLGNQVDFGVAIPRIVHTRIAPTLILGKPKFESAGLVNTSICILADQVFGHFIDRMTSIQQLSHVLS